MKSSYNNQEVTLLIKDLTGKVTPVTLEEKNRRVANGEFERSIMIEEYPISKEYSDIVWESMKPYAPMTAIAVGNVAEQIYKDKGNKLVLVSIIRAGIPIGILIKRYLEQKYNIVVPHYAISLVKGLDKNAMKYILERHDAEGIQFIDGWTGKGTVTKELVESAKEYKGVDASLAVLSDAIGVSKYCGIRKDFAVPSAPLNASVTGLVSITIFNNDLVSDTDFHGAMYLKDLESIDKSKEFLDLITSYFDFHCNADFSDYETVNEVQKVADDLEVSLKLLNPGINEAARAILRRNLEKLLVVDKNDFDVQCIMKLAELKNVPVEEYPLKYYKAISVAKE